MKARGKLFWLEAAVLCGVVALSIGWYCAPESLNWEPIVVAASLVFVATEVARRNWPQAITGRFASQTERVKHRETLRKSVLEEIYKCRARSLRQDVIVRNVDRMDSYPNLDEKERGISPWFRVGMVDTYERGVVLCLCIGGLKAVGDELRFVDYANGEKSDRTAWLMADVPYDSIVSINFEGDKFYHYPHIYCLFNFDGEPYERKWFAEKIDMPGGHPFFKEISSYEAVRKNDPEGQLYFG